MTDYDRMIQLFGYETDNGRHSLLWQNPGYFSRPGGQQGRYLDDGLDAWKAQKRAFTREEVLEGQWLKIADHGNRCIVRFHADGTLTEADLFNPRDSWSGQWQLVGAILRVNIGEYELDIVANREGAIHSGIEFESGGRLPDAYFKVIHLV